MHLPIEMRELRENSVLLYDGLCGFCDGVVQFILARDKAGSLRFAPLQGSFAAALLARHPHLRSVDSIILVQPPADDMAELIAIKSDAALLILRYVGGIWRIPGTLASVFPRAL